GAAAEGQPGDADASGIHAAIEPRAARLREPEELVDDGAHVARLVLEVVERRAATLETVAAGEREGDRGHHEAAAGEVLRQVGLATARIEQPRAVHDEGEPSAG